MKEEHKERGEEKGSKENLEEKTFEYDEKREHVDWSKVLSDFGKWVDQKPEKTLTRFDRFNANMFHIAMTVITGGAYLFVYMIYYLNEFMKSHNFEDYKRTSYIKKLDDGEEVVQD